MDLQLAQRRKVPPEAEDNFAVILFFPSVLSSFLFILPFVLSFYTVSQKNFPPLNSL